MPYQALGVLSAFVGSTVQTAGLLVQKRAITEHDARTSSPELNSARESTPTSRPYYMQFGWIMGIAMWLAGQVLCGFGEGTAPQSVTAVMGSWSILFTLIISTCCLGEEVTNQAKLAAFCLAVGCSWIIIAEPSNSHTQTANSLFRACRSFSFIFAIIICSGFLMCMSVVSATRSRRTPSETLSSFEFICVSAVFGWFAAISSKSMFSLIVTSFTEATLAFQNLFFVATVVGVAVFGLSQIHFLNMGFRKGRAAVVIPCYVGLAMTGQMVIGGALFFKEFENLGKLKIVTFWLGLIPLLAGVFLVANHESSIDTIPAEAPLSGDSTSSQMTLLTEMGTQSPSIVVKSR
eukprot:TRINITY_DN2385_c0_g2_i1.p1 TRINITY_DN2385_c0_g2~~TRINITY_DN2385_c0_g2_i1.p1  ORF type:complete len:348 (+),score=37.42 TRINITY_DN2385_c0_g2_i1:134-1177(+)